MPASFENAPLLMPIIMTVPNDPPATAEPVKASFMIKTKTSVVSIDLSRSCVKNHDYDKSLTKVLGVLLSRKEHFKIQTPRIAVAGLNPHAGEGGKIGREDLDLITPILERLNGQPAILTGPHSADTLFHAAARQHYDAAIAMYHDQALIPIKTLDFDQGVNLTLGLPFIRTSPDHGTALDIAGRGIANPNSCIAALRLAEELGQKR